MSKELLNYQTDVLHFIHITDTHLLNKADETLNNINTKQTFELVLSQCQKRYKNIDFLLFTGDISQTGTEESYALFKSIIGQCGIPIFCVPGNHDTPNLLQNVIPNTPDDSIKIIHLGKFSLILLNSWIYNEHHGNISQQCLQELENYLQSNNGLFNIIAIHHPPTKINSKWLDEIALQNKDEFLQIIKKSFQNTLLLFGHVHQEFDLQKNKLRILATPSTCYQFKVNTDVMQLVSFPQAAYRFVQLSKSNTIHATVHYIK